MKAENYYEEIKHLIKKNEINKRARILEENNDKVNTYWHIGRLILEAQGGEKRAKYGNGLIKEWSSKLTNLYGNNYSERSLREMRQFYLVYPKWRPPGAISWSNIKKIISIKDENKRNYYINLCIEKNLSKRELIQAIKDNSYERLLVKPQNIEIISQKDSYKIENNLKNPIIIKLEKEDKAQIEFYMNIIDNTLKRDFHNKTIVLL